VKPVTFTKESDMESDPYGGHPPIDIDKVRKGLDGKFVWYHWNFDEAPEEGNDVLVHRIAGMSLGEDQGTECVVYQIPHRRGCHDDTMQNSGHVRVEADVIFPSGKGLCPICFPDGLPSVVDDPKKTD
jgi:hypothetical protein